MPRKPNIIKHTQHTKKCTCEHTYISAEVPTYLLPCILTCIPTLQYSISLHLTLPYHAFWYIPLHCYNKLLHSIVTFHSIPFHVIPLHSIPYMCIDTKTNRVSLRRHDRDGEMAAPNSPLGSIDKRKFTTWDGYNAHRQISGYEPIINRKTNQN